VANKDMLAYTFLDIPDSESGVSRTGDGSVGIRHFEATDCGGVTSKDVYACSVLVN
jgi:hypothetical protein